MQIYGSVLLIVIILLISAIRILREYERGVIFRLGRLIDAKGPGLIILVPIIDRMVKVSLRTIVLDVPTQDVITLDNVSVQVNAVVYFRVVNPEKAIVAVEDFRYATSQLSQTTLRSIAGQAELDELLAQRDKINKQLQQVIDRHSDPWGIKVTLVEVKQIDLPIEMKRAIAKQAEAERERRAKVIKAEGEFQASKQLMEAAKVISPYPVAVQLRYLQTLSEIATENNSTTVFPIPLDMMGAFVNALKGEGEKES